jgi:hypothetical protein
MEVLRDQAIADGMTTLKQDGIQVIAILNVARCYTCGCDNPAALS